MDEVADAGDAVGVETEVILVSVSIGADAQGGGDGVLCDGTDIPAFHPAVFHLQCAQTAVCLGGPGKVVGGVQERSDIVHLLHDFHGTVARSFVERDADSVRGEGGEFVAQEVGLARDFHQYVGAFRQVVSFFYLLQDGIDCFCTVPPASVAEEGFTADGVTVECGSIDGIGLRAGEGVEGVV